MINISVSDVQLTALAASAGCAAKIDPGNLSRMLQPIRGLFPALDFPALRVGLELPDDAAVYQINETQAIISTVDFFPPIVDDPYHFGAIAAANAMSDVYAMGGDVLFGINLAAFPADLDLAILGEILRGGAEKMREAGGIIVGGHTITDPEPKYGVAVTGMVHPDHILAKGGAQPGDVLVLTKRLGTGVITTALKQGKARGEDVDLAVASMSHLNKTASGIARRYPVHAMTDVTGYSLMGHAHEMAHLSAADFILHYEALQWLPGAQGYAAAGTFPGGMGRNRGYYSQWVTLDRSLDETQSSLLFDPQTSGGLLIALPPHAANEMIAELEAANEWAALIGTINAGVGNIYVSYTA